PPQRNSPTPPPAPTRSRARLLSPPATRSTQPPPLSLHDALPIFLLWAALRQSRAALLSSVEKLTASEGRLARLLANIPGGVFTRDRKSTRLNSSHVKRSYAVFCLKKKNLGDPRDCTRCPAREVSR